MDKDEEKTEEPEEVKESIAPTNSGVCPSRTGHPEPMRMAKDLFCGRLRQVIGRCGLAQ